MRTILRYLVVSGLAVALAWGVFVLRVGDRTLFGHARSLTRTEVGDAWARLGARLDDRLGELNDATHQERKKKQAARARAQALADRRRPAASAAPARSTSARGKPADARAAKAPLRRDDDTRADGSRKSGRPAEAAPARAVIARDEARVQRLSEAQKLARAMHRADASAPPPTTKVDERIPGSGRSRVDDLLAD